MSGNNACESDRIDTIVDKRYRITGLLGRGGMGSVYRAEHVTIKRPVALKLLHGEIGQMEQIRARFEREAFAAGRVDHPNCVTASDFGELDDGTRYLVMELLDGESLADILDRERILPVQKALHIIRHLLHGLRYAHRAGVVHRDIKPDNVIIEHKDDDPCFARLLDFGIAKLLGEAEKEAGGEKLTQAGIAFGTPIYMSPEQAYGEPVDPRADLYALSVLLYEMLAGRPPFVDDDKMTVLHMHSHTPPPSFAQVAPEANIPDSVESLVRKGLAKNKEERFADADEYLNALIDLVPEWASDPIWSERTPTAMRQAIHTPMPGIRRHTGPTTANSAPPPPGPPSPAAAAPKLQPIASGQFRWRGLTRLELGLAIGLLLVGFMFVILVVTSGDKTEDRLETYKRQLDSAATCAERRLAVVELRKLGDARAIPALRQAHDRKAAKGSPQSNACLVKDAREAIEALKPR